MYFSGKLVKLRAYDLQDFDGYFKMLQNPKIQETNGLFYPLSRELEMIILKRK